jgi:hypothetical protein
VAVHVVDAPGASTVTGHDADGGIPVPENAVSLTPMPLIVVLPVFVTAYRNCTVSPAAVTTDGAAVFTTSSPGACAGLTSADEFAESTTVPSGAVPVACAVFVTTPASISAVVSVYVAEHVVDAPGPSTLSGQVTTGAVPVPENAVSTTPTLLIVSLPVFVTTNVYVTCVPDQVADFTTDRPGDSVTVTVADDGPDVTAAPDGPVPAATAVLVTVPASMSC